MQLKTRYKVDEWSRYLMPGSYKSAYYKPWWCPVWLRCYHDVVGMCRTIEEAEEQARKHKNQIDTLPRYLDI